MLSFKGYVSRFLALIRALPPLDTYIFSYTNLLDRHGLLGVTRQTAFQFRNKGIRCNAVLPGGKIIVHRYIYSFTYLYISCQDKYSIHLNGCVML
jgi:hypothetical protein